MVKVIWTEPALNDLDAIADYIALDKPDAAARLVKRVFQHVEMLVNHPELGSFIPEMKRNKRYRQIVERPCRVFYRHDAEASAIHVLGVMRGERLFQKTRITGRDSEH